MSVLERKHVFERACSLPREEKNGESNKGGECCLHGEGTEREGREIICVDVFLTGDSFGRTGECTRKSRLLKCEACSVS